MLIVDGIEDLLDLLVDLESAICDMEIDFLNAMEDDDEDMSLVNALSDAAQAVRDAEESIRLVR